MNDRVDRLGPDVSHCHYTFDFLPPRIINADSASRVRFWRVSFNRVPTATVYRVEWAPSPAGPWTNFTGATSQLDAIGQFAGESYTCSVPMCYRVVASVTNALPVPVPVGMVRIPVGTNSGTDPDFGAYSLTNATAFYMDATEVTKDQWDEVYMWAVANGYGFDNVGSGKASSHPVQTVNWYDCVKWCNARSEKEGRTPCYTVGGATYKTGQSAPDCSFFANGYRLPTNTEWEYAARGGASGHRFPWSDNEEIRHSLANYYSSSYFSYGFRAVCR